MMNSSEALMVLAGGSFILTALFSVLMLTWSSCSLAPASYLMDRPDSGIFLLSKSQQERNPQNAKLFFLLYAVCGHYWIQFRMSH